jgi:hypothetical protein
MIRRGNGWGAVVVCKWSRAIQLMCEKENLFSSLSFEKTFVFLQFDFSENKNYKRCIGLILAAS